MVKTLELKKAMKTPMGTFVGYRIERETEKAIGLRKMYDVKLMEKASREAREIAASKLRAPGLQLEGRWAYDKDYPLVWLPRSQIRRKRNVLEIPDWLAERI